MENHGTGNNPRRAGAMGIAHTDK